MIKEYLQEKKFSLHDFLLELDKKELLLLHFLLINDDNPAIVNVGGDEKALETFYRASNSVGSSKIRKFTKERMISLATEIFDDNPGTEDLVYISFYHRVVESDFEFLNSKLNALYNFVALMFSKRNISYAIDYSKNEDVGCLAEQVVKKFKANYLFNDKPILNTLGVLIYNLKLEKIIQGDHIDLETSLKNHEVDFPKLFKKMKDHIEVQLIKQFETIEQQKHLTLHKQFGQLERELLKSNKNLTTKEASLKKVREQNKELNGELKELKRSIKQLSTTEDTLRRSKETIEELSQKLNQYKQRENGLRAEIEEEYQNKILTLEQQLEQATMEANRNIVDNTNLSKQVQGLELQLKGLREQLTAIEQQIEVEQTISSLSILSDYLKNNGLTHELSEVIKPYLSNYTEIDTEATMDSHTKVEIEPEPDTPKDDIGYCVIENGVHYVVFPDKTRKEIINIPEDKYIGEWQFVRVLNDGTFRWAFPYVYSEFERDYLVTDFGYVTINENNQYLVSKSNTSHKPLKMIPSYINLRTDQIVAVNSKGEFLKFYRTLHFNAEHFIVSIKAKGQEAFYLLNKYTNGLLVRNIETEEEGFKIIDNPDMVHEHSVILLEGDRYITTFFPKFYTFSAFYTKSEHGPITHKDDKVLITKMSGEVSVVKNIPTGTVLVDGEVICTDEFGNYMYIKKDKAFDQATAERKILSNSHKEPTKDKKSFSDKINLSKDVLIVGKPTYETSYRMSLYKKGYRAEVIDGYSPWTKIKMALKDKDAIVVIGEFVSHENMWQIKDEVLNIPVIYPESDGANRIADKVEQVFTEQNA